MSEIKYLMDGSAVYVVETTSKGLLVERLYEGSHGDEIMSDEDHPFVVPAVFDVAPTAIKDKRIAELDAKIATLQEKANELSAIDRHLKMKRAEADEKLARFDKLKLLFDFIDGKITHYVEVKYCDYDIIEFRKAVSDSGNARDLKLLTLFGQSKGDLHFGLNRYYDGSGSNAAVWPCCSHEEALQVIERQLLESMSARVSESYVKCADKYGIAVPAEYRQAVKDEKVKNLRDGMTKAAAAADKAEKELRAAEAL